MKRLAVIISVFALVACGGTDSGQTTEAGGGPDVSAAGEVSPAAPEAPGIEVAVDPNVQSCLDLVRQTKFQEALPVCLAALDVDPDNQQVSDAVDQARTETAKVAAAEAVGQAAAEGTAEDAASQLEGATGGIADKLGE